MFPGQDILGLEQQQFLCYIFSSKQTHAETATETLEITDYPRENIFRQEVVIYDVIYPWTLL